MAHRIRLPKPEWCLLRSVVPHIHVSRDRVLVNLSRWADAYRRRFHLPTEGS